MADKKDTDKKAPREKKDKKPAAKETSVKVEKKPTRAKSMKDIGAVAAEAQAAAPASAQTAQVVAFSGEPQKKEPKLDKLGRAYATGRRKDAVARVWLKPGAGRVVVNGKDQAIYFSRQTHRLILNQPFLVVDRVGKFDVMATVAGGGLSGQAGAVRHGISRALENFDPALRPPLKKAGMMTRDDRIVERKKVGKHKARRTKQWAKR